MRGFLPSWCRISGYALLLLSVFVPPTMSLLGAVHDGNIILVKLVMKLVIWMSLFAIFLSKTKDEDEVVGLRAKALQYALYLWGIYYVVMLVRSAMLENLQLADNSAAIVYMVISVICMEFLFRKHRAEKLFRRNKQ